MEKIDKQAVLNIIAEISGKLGATYEAVVDDINALPTEKSYTTRNDEVVKIVEDRIAELEQLRLTGVSGSDFEIVCTIRIQDLIDLLTKLKEDKK